MTSTFTMTGKMISSTTDATDRSGFAASPAVEPGVTGTRPLVRCSRAVGRPPEADDVLGPSWVPTVIGHCIRMGSPVLGRLEELREHFRPTLMGRLLAASAAQQRSGRTGPRSLGLLQVEVAKLGTEIARHETEE